MAFVYILYSEIDGSYYIGSCKNIEERLTEHKNQTFENSYTSSVNDWDLFFSIPELSYSQARKIELHIKKMKSKKFILNLKKFPEMSQKLINKYI